jgi:hypothetical protein
MNATTSKTLKFIVSVQIDDNGECDPMDIGAGLQSGINIALQEGMITSPNDDSTLINGFSVDFLSSSEVTS